MPVPSTDKSTSCSAASSNDSRLLQTFAEKFNHFEKVKLHNFKESMRLEGFAIDISHVPADKPARQLLKKQLIRKYSRQQPAAVSHG